MALDQVVILLNLLQFVLGSDCFGLFDFECIDNFLFAVLCVVSELAGAS